jgi:hypothetical protein
MPAASAFPLLGSAPEHPYSEEMAVQFLQWQYRTVDLNDLPPRVRELDILNAAGNVGWELVVITANRIAFLKRQIDDDPTLGRAPSRRGR